MARGLGPAARIEAEGMSASDPISAEKESRLANEHRRVSAALDAIVADRQKSGA